MKKLAQIGVFTITFYCFTFHLAVGQGLRTEPAEEKTYNGWAISIHHGSGQQKLVWDESFYNTYDTYGDAPYGMLNTFNGQINSSYLFPQKDNQLGRLELSQREVVLGLSKTFNNGLGLQLNFLYRERPSTLFRKYGSGGSTIGTSTRYYDTATTRLYDTTQFIYYTYPTQTVEYHRQIGVDFSLFYNLLNFDLNKSLNVHAGIGLRHFTRRVGCNGWFSGETHLEYSYQNMSNPQDYQSREKVPGSTESFNESVSERFTRTGLAFSMNVGFEWVHYFYNNWGYSLGLFYDRVSFTPNRMTRTELTLNGEDQLPNLDSRQTDFRFGNAANDNPDDDTKPRVLPKENYNFNVIMFRAGICYRL